MKTATEGQLRDFAIRVLNLNRADLDGEAYQRGTEGFSNGEVATRVAAFVNNGLSFVMKGPGVLVIDRTKSFDPAKFIGDGWTIWRGPKNRNGLEGEEEQDARSLELTEFDFAKALFTACLTEGEARITGEEKLARHLAAGHIRLDARVGQALFEEKGHATLEWLYQTFGITWFELPGTTLRGADGLRYFLCLCRGDDGQWSWDYDWLGNGRDVKFPSAVLASSA